jgi:protein-disulfide isomerase
MSGPGRHAGIQESDPPMASNTSKSTKSSKSRASKEQQRRKAERAAAARKARQRQERRRQLLTAAAVVAVIAVVVGVGFVIHSKRSGDDAASIPPPGSQDGITIGSENAPHTVVVYEDFLDPASGEFEQATHAQLSQLADAGKVQVEYRPVIAKTDAGEYSTRSTLIWWLTDSKFGDVAGLKLHDLLFAHQPATGGPYPSRDDLYQLAAQAGATADDIKKAVENQEQVEEVADATKSARALGVDSTPYVVLDGERFTDGGKDTADLAKDLLNALQ